MPEQAARPLSNIAFGPNPAFESTSNFAFPWKVSKACPLFQTVVVFIIYLFTA
jgi:hypothetical protein